MGRPGRWIFCDPLPQGSPLHTLHPAFLQYLRSGWGRVRTGLGIGLRVQRMSCTPSFLRTFGQSLQDKGTQANPGWCCMQGRTFPRRFRQCLLGTPAPCSGSGLGLLGTPAPCCMRSLRVGTVQQGGIGIKGNARLRLRVAFRLRLSIGERPDAK